MVKIKTYIRSVFILKDAVPISLFNDIMEQDNFEDTFDHTKIEGIELGDNVEKAKESSKKGSKVVVGQSDKISNESLKWDIKEYRLNRITDALMAKADVIQAVFIDRVKGISEDIKTTVTIHESWIGLLGFLIGAISIKYGARMTEVLSGYGILNQNIQIKKTLPNYLDREVDVIQLYKLNELGVYLEYIPNYTILRHSIGKAIKALGIKESLVSITLYNPYFEIDNVDELKTVKKEKRKSKKSESTVKNISIAQDSSGKLMTKSLALLSKKSNIPDKFEIKAVIMDGEPEAVDGNLYALAFVMTYLTAYFEDEAIVQFKKCTKKDIIGVTDDNQRFFGTFSITSYFISLIIICIFHPPFCIIRQL